MKEENNIQELFQRYLLNAYSREDVDILIQYFGLEEEPEDLHRLIEDELKKQPLEDTDWKRVEFIQRRVGEQLVYRIKPKTSYTFILKIAAILLVVGAVSFLLLKFKAFDFLGFQDLNQIVQLDSLSDIAPGGNKATLTFSGGEAIVLDQDKDGIDASTGNLTYSDGELLKRTASEVQYATLATPRGGQYQVTLPDGTKVWLNASSSIKYPTRFDGTNREVELAGEGYFEVVSNANKPFVVKSKGQQIVVLGTAFNINAYEDEPLVRSTLVAGSIRLEVDGQSEPWILKPNEQAVLQGENLQVVQVETNVYTAWRNGQISLNQSDLAGVIRQIERWYDVEFDIDYMPPAEPLFGVLKRDVQLSEILDALELHYQVKFKREGRRVRMTR